MSDGTKVSIDTLAADPTPAAAPPRELGRGALVGRYVVVGRIGAGGMGVVYAAFDPDLDRKVALKLVRAATQRDQAPAFARLLREAQAMARFTHPNIVAIHDVGVVDTELFIAMELVEGATLRGWLAAAPRGWREIVAAFRQAGTALAAAHARGIVHRDFKPENVLVDGEAGPPTKEGRSGATLRVRVADFGLARSAEGAADLATGSITPASPAVTAADVVVGTPAYMAPEQRRGIIDARADQYSFGVALREALGAAPPAWLGKIVARCLRERPEERYPSMADVVGALGRDPAARRRRLAALAAPAVILAAAWGATVALRDDGRVCRAAAARAAAPWSPERRGAARAALTATGSTNAEATVDRVSAALDRYRDELAAMTGESCSRARGEQSAELADLRAACLDERRASLEALVTVLAAPDQTIVNRAVDAAQSLPPVRDCADVVRLREPAPLPRDPRARARLAVLRGELAAARAADAVGRAGGVIEGVRAAAVESAALGHRPTEAQALLTLGMLESSLHQWKAAVVALEGASLAAEAGNDRHVAQSAATLLVLVDNRAGVPAEARLWAARSRAIIEGLGNDPADLGPLENNLATVDWGEEKFADALAGYQKSIALQTRAGGHKLRIAFALTNIGLVYWSLGQHELAVAYERRAVALGEEALGPDNPQVGSFLSNLASSLGELGRDDEAEAANRRALRILEAAYGPDSPNVATSLSGIGFRLAKHGKLDEALAMHQRALAIFEKSLGPDARKVGVTLGYVGDCLRQLKRYEEARPLLERALAIHRKLVGDDHEDVAEARAQLAELERNEGHLDAALAGFNRARDIWQRIGDQPSVAQALVFIGAIQLERGDRRGALESLERAMAMRQTLPGNPIALAETRFYLAQALAQTHGDAARARDLMTKARPDLSKDERATADAWLASHP